MSYYMLEQVIDQCHKIITVVNCIIIIVGSLNVQWSLIHFERA